VKKLVDYVLGGESSGVVDRRLTPRVVGDDTHKAVADPTPLVADRPDRDSLGFDRVVLESEPDLPACETAIDRW
jgi:hypothetical protein